METKKGKLSGAVEEAMKDKDKIPGIRDAAIKAVMAVLMKGMQEGKVRKTSEMLVFVTPEIEAQALSQNEIIIFGITVGKMIADMHLVRNPLEELLSTLQEIQKQVEPKNAKKKVVTKKKK